MYRFCSLKIVPTEYLQAKLFPASFARAFGSLFDLAINNKLLFMNRVSETDRVHPMLLLRRGSDSFATSCLYVQLALARKN